MSGDISTTWDQDLQSCDWTLSGADLKSGDDIVTAILISLFTDRLANEDDSIPDKSNDPRGWVGDLNETILIGSRLWLLNRSTLTQNVATTAKNMAAEALKWLIDDNVVAKFDINTEIVLPNQLRLQVVAYKQDGTKIALDFTNAWSGVN